MPLATSPPLAALDDAVVTAGGFAAGERVAVTLDSAPGTLAPTVADAAGAVSYAFTVPRDLEAGRHTLVFQGQSRTSVFSFQLAGPGSPSTPTAVIATGAGGLVSGGATTVGTGALPLTGTNSVLIMLLGATLVAGGIGLVMLGRAESAGALRDWLTA
ncbi:MAG: hypothetical protein H7233_00315 [Pseudorhodobacter sp.]|nr:hypothetical protein [Frankiaceae bacterium]